MQLSDVDRVEYCLSTSIFTQKRSNINSLTLPMKPDGKYWDIEATAATYWVVAVLIVVFAVGRRAMWFAMKSSSPILKNITFIFIENVYFTQFYTCTATQLSISLDQRVLFSLFNSQSEHRIADLSIFSWRHHG